MSLQCSLFGHRYDNTEVRRDREEQGSELVETVREVKVCARCGETLVISETTEVTTVETADDAEGDTDTGRPADDTGSPAGDSPDAGTTEPTAGGGDGGAPIGGTVDRAIGETDGAGGGSADAAGATSIGNDTDGDLPPARKDDAVIIDEDGEEQPTPDWSDDGDEEADAVDDGWEPDTDPLVDGEAGQEPPSTASSGGLTVPEGEFHCPECEFTTAVESSSLREGDFCPECHRGALEHHTE